MRKIGDKVRIKKHLTTDMHDFVPELLEFVGEEGVIISIDEDEYEIAINGKHTGWSWYEEYFESDETEGVKSFEEIIYFNRSKEENWDIEEKAEKLGFKNLEDLVYLGYEIKMKVLVRENNKHKILEIDGIDVSDKNIFV